MVPFISEVIFRHLLLALYIYSLIRSNFCFNIRFNFPNNFLGAHKCMGEARIFSVASYSCDNFYKLGANILLSIANHFVKKVHVFVIRKMI